MRGTPRGPETKLEHDLISRNWASQIWSKMLKFWRVGHADFDQIWIILMYHILSLLVLHVGAGSTCEMQYVCISETGIYLWYSYHLDVYVKALSRYWSFRCMNIWDLYTDPLNLEITVLVVAETYCNIKPSFEWISKIHSKLGVMLQYVSASTSTVLVGQSYR
jgi:hypothetical protein